MIDEQWYEVITTYSPETLQALLEFYEAQQADLDAKVTYMRLLLDLSSRPPEPLPRRMDAIHESFSTLPKFDMTQWRKELTEARNPPPDPEPTEGGSTWIAKSK